MQSQSRTQSHQLGFCLAEWGMLAGETKKRDWRWQGEPGKPWEKVAWERTRGQAEMWQAPSGTLLSQSQQGFSSLLSLELIKWGQIWFRSKGKFRFWSKVARCEFCFRVHMLPLQAGGWGCFIGVSSVGKGREGSGQSSPPSLCSGAAQNYKCKCSEQPFCTRPPAAILDWSAVTCLSAHGPQPHSWIGVLWLASLHTAPSRHLGLKCCDLPLCTRPPAAILEFETT